MSYNVVFEYTTKAGGLAGLRFTKKFHDQAEYQATTIPNTKVVIPDTSEKNAEFLIALTPEICHFTAAVEASCNSDGTIDIYTIGRHLSLAICSVQYNRKYLKENDWNDNTSVGSDEFEKCDPGSEPLNEKSRLLQKALSLCTHKYGWVEVGSTVTSLQAEIKAIITARLLTNF